MKRYVKNGGASRRRFYAIHRKPGGVVKMTPPPPPGRRFNGYCDFSDVHNVRHLQKLWLITDSFRHGAERFVYLTTTIKFDITQLQFAN